MRRLPERGAKGPDEVRLRGVRDPCEGCDVERLRVVAVDRVARAQHPAVGLFDGSAHPTFSRSAPRRARLRVFLPDPARRDPVEDRSGRSFVEREERLGHVAGPSCAARHRPLSPPDERVRIRPDRDTSSGSNTLTAMQLVRVSGVTKSFGSVRALDGASFEIGEGVTGLLGSNGAGKTTSLKILIGLIDPDAGSVEVLGRDTRGSVEYRTRIGYSPEHDCLPPGASAAEFLAYMAELSGLPRAAARLRASDLLRHVGLFEERYRPMGTYSTGMKQRVKLAQALVHDPVLAFLDEPTAGLDPLGRRDMLELIRRVGREFGISIVISTHLMGDVERTCDAVIVLDAGKVLRTGVVAGLTEETETVLVDLVEGAAELARVLSERGIAVQLDGNRLTLPQVSGDDYDVLRDAIVETGALLYRLAPERHSLGERVRRAVRGGGVVSTAGRAEIFDLGYQGYDGERTSRWRRRRAIWRDGVRISLGLGRGIGGEGGALGPDRAGARAGCGAGRARRVPGLGSDELR